MKDVSAPGRTAAFDRSAAERTDPDLIVRLASDPETRVLVIDADRAPTDAAGAIRLFSMPLARALFMAAADKGLANETTQVDRHEPETGSEGIRDRLAFLGRRDGVAVLLAALPGAADIDAGVIGSGPLGPDRRSTADTVADWRSLRALHPMLDAADGALLIEAVSLARWIIDAGFCSFCGGRAALTTAGWARRCAECGREHFPRTDPAVIVAVTDGDRLLLGSNALWEQQRYSCFAGFVESGESLEDAVRREVLEESGIDVDQVSYAGSQAWPFPRSLMLGFRATSRDARTAHPDGDEILDVRWFTRAEIRAAYAGDSDVILPGRPSIAHELISTWAAEIDVDGGSRAGERA